MLRTDPWGPLDRSLLVIGNMLFVILYVSSCFFNRIALDDFYFLSLAKRFDPIEAMIVERSTWSARWCSVLLNQIVLSFHGSRYDLLFFGVIALVLFVLSIDRILRRMMGRFDIPFDRRISVNLSIFIVGAIFHASFSIGQTWFWLCSACTYLVGTIMLLLGLSTLIGKNDRIDPILCCIAFLYVGGSSEPLAVIMLAVLFLSIVIGRSRIPLRMSLLAFFSCLLGFSILYSGEGNFKRAAHFQDIDVVHAAVLNVKMTAIIILHQLPSVLPKALLFSIPIGAYFADRSVVRSEGWAVLKRVISIPIVFLLSIYFFQLPVTYATQDIAAGRTLFPISVLAFTSFVGVVFFLRTWLDRFRTAAVRIALCATIAFNGLTLFDQLKVLPVYASAYDRRIEKLERMTYGTGLIIVDPLPSAGMLLSADISTDTLHFSNQHLRNGLGLKAQIRRSERSTIDQR